MNNIKKLSFDYNKFDLNFNEITILVDEIEKFKRRKIADKDAINYVDPLKNVEKILIPVNHLIIGRRGSGKTSLLLKVREKLNSEATLELFYDLQSKRNRKKEDILILILIEIFQLIKNDISKISDWIPIEQRIKKSFLKKVFRPFFKFFKQSFKWNAHEMKIDNVYYLAEYLIFELKKISQIEEGTEIIKNKLNEKGSDSFSKVDSNIELNQIPFLKNKISFEYSYRTKKNESEILSSKNIFSREEALENLKDEIINLIASNFELTSKKMYVFLDDFYQIKIQNQPFIINFLHEISKESKSGAFCFKLSLVPNRFKLNSGDEKTLSNKDDFTSVILDRDFDDFDSNKEMLIRIICGIKPDLELNKEKIEKLFNDNDVLQKVIIASGFLPRTFLDFFILMISLSKAENYTKINSKVFPAAINELRRIKDELINEEADISEEKMLLLTRAIENEIVDYLKTNFILYPKKSFEKHEKILVTLFNLGYLHRVKELEKTDKGVFVPIYVDMTFTHGVKSFPKGFKQIKFWDKRRYSPSSCQEWCFKDEIINEIIK